MLPDEGTGSSFPHGHVFRKKKKIERKKERNIHQRDPDLKFLMLYCKIWQG